MNASTCDLRFTVEGNECPILRTNNVPGPALRFSRPLPGSNPAARHRQQKGPRCRDPDGTSGAPSGMSAFPLRGPACPSGRKRPLGRLVGKRSRVSSPRPLPDSNPAARHRQQKGPRCRDPDGTSGAPFAHLLEPRCAPLAQSSSLGYHERPRRQPGACRGRLGSGYRCRSSRRDPDTWCRTWTRCR